MFLNKIKRPFLSIGQFMKEQSLPFILENSKLLAQAIFTILSIGIGIWFIKNEHTELAEVNRIIFTANWRFVLLGILLTFGYIILQGLMYVASFSAIRHRISLVSAVILFLKRNLISIFLPAGGISSLAFFTGEIEKKGITKSQIHFASSVYGFVGILSVIIVAVPIFIYSLLIGGLGSDEWIAFVAILVLIVVIYLLYRSIVKKGLFYRWLVRSFSFFEVFSVDIRNNRISKKQFFVTVLYSILIEIVGITHL